LRKRPKLHGFGRGLEFRLLGCTRTGNANRFALPVYDSERAYLFHFELGMQFFFF